MAIVPDTLHRPTRYAIYTRVSTDDQNEGTSPETQLAQGRAYVAARGGVIVGEYEETHKRNLLHERPQMTKLRASVKRGEVDIVLAYAIDRLSSNDTHVAILDDEWDRAGVAMEFVTEVFERSPVGRMIRSAKVFAAAVEHEKIRERTGRGLRAKAEVNGKPLGTAPASYGLAYADDTKSRYVENAETARWVRFMFDEAERGTSIRGICKALEARGVLPPRHERTGSLRWGVSVVRQILTEEHYTGTGYAFRDKVVSKPGQKQKVVRLPIDHPDRVKLPDGTFPVLISQVQFDRVAAMLAANVHEKARLDRRPEVGFFRRGLGRCGVCGCVLVVRTGNGGRGPSYKCNGYDTRGCGKTSIQVEQVDVLALMRLQKLVRDRAYAEAEFARRGTAAAEVSDLDGARRVVADIERRRTNLARRMAGLDDDDAAAVLMGELKRLGQQLTEAKAYAAALEIRDRARTSRAGQVRSALDYLAEIDRDLGAGLASLTFDKVRHLLHLLNARLVLYPAKVTPRWTVQVDPVDPAAVTGYSHRRCQHVR